MVSRRKLIAGMIGGGMTGYAILGDPASWLGVDSAAETSTENKTLTFSDESYDDNNSFIVTNKTKSVISTVNVNSENDYKILLLDRYGDKIITLANYNAPMYEESVMNLDSINSNQTEFRLITKGKPDDWKVSLKLIRDMPELSTFSDNIPLVKEGSKTRVFGPINLGPYPKTKISLSTFSKSNSPTKLVLINGQGTRREEVITIKGNETREKSILTRMDYRGFIKIVTKRKFTLNVKLDPRYTRKSGEEGDRYTPVQ